MPLNTLSLPPPASSHTVIAKRVRLCWENVRDASRVSRSAGCRDDGQMADRRKSETMAAFISPARIPLSARAECLGHSASPDLASVRTPLLENMSTTPQRSGFPFKRHFKGAIVIGMKCFQLQTAANLHLDGHFETQVQCCLLSGGCACAQPRTSTRALALRQRRGHENKSHLDHRCCASAFFLIFRHKRRKYDENISACSE